MSHPDFSTRFGDLRALLQQPPDRPSWEQLRIMLGSFETEPLRERVLPYVRSHVTRWPEDLRTASLLWLRHTEPSCREALASLLGTLSLKIVCLGPEDAGISLRLRQLGGLEARRSKLNSPVSYSITCHARPDLLLHLYRHDPVRSRRRFSKRLLSGADGLLMCLDTRPQRRAANELALRAQQMLLSDRAHPPPSLILATHMDQTGGPPPAWLRKLGLSSNTPWYPSGLQGSQSHGTREALLVLSTLAVERDGLVSLAKTLHTLQGSL